jgi:hypothetical protein
MDLRTQGIGAQILRELDIGRMKLLCSLCSAQTHQCHHHWIQSPVVHKVFNLSIEPLQAMRRFGDRVDVTLNAICCAALGRRTSSANQRRCASVHEVLPA